MQTCHHTPRGISLCCLSWGKRDLQIPEASHRSLEKEAPLLHLWVSAELQSGGQRSHKRIGGQAKLIFTAMILLQVGPQPQPG